MSQDKSHAERTINLQREQSTCRKNNQLIERTISWHTEQLTWRESNQPTERTNNLHREQSTCRENNHPWSGSASFDTLNIHTSIHKDTLNWLVPDVRLKFTIHCWVPSYHAAVGYTHSLVWEPRKGPTCVKPIVTDTGGNQSSTQVHQYLRTNLGWVHVLVPVLEPVCISSNQAWMLIGTLGLNAASNHIV